MERIVNSIAISPQGTYSRHFHFLLGLYNSKGNKLISSFGIGEQRRKEITKTRKLRKYMGNLLNEGISEG